MNCQPNIYNWQDIPGCEGESTIISNLFAGQKRSTIKCDTQCSDVSSKFMALYRYYL